MEKMIDFLIKLLSNEWTVVPFIFNYQHIIFQDYFNAFDSSLMKIIYAKQKCKIRT